MTSVATFDMPGLLSVTGLNYACTVTNSIFSNVCTYSVNIKIPLYWILINLNTSVLLKYITCLS